MTDVIVIGGGIVGCAAAFFLAADGIDVLLLEQDDLNMLASGANAGSLHVQIPHDPFVKQGEAWARAFAPTLRLLKASVELWTDVEGLIDADLDVAISGGLLVASSAEEMGQIERKARIERAAGIDIALLDQTSLRDLAPYISERMVGGAYCPIEGKANPLVAGPAFAAAAQRLGGTVMRRTRVEAIAREGDIFHVRTAGGRVYCAPRVVNAAGIWTSRISAMLGLSLVTQAFPIQVNVTEPVAPLVRHLVYSARDKLTMKQTKVGTILIGGGWPARLDAEGRAVASPESVALNLAVALEAVPALASVKVVRTWAAVVAGTESWRPFIGEAEGLPGFYIGYVPWMGFTTGPLVGRIVANLIQEKPAPVDFDLAPFRP